MKTEEVKKVSFRVRRIYYDQFVAGTKKEELRALKLYWVKILRPTLLLGVPKGFYQKHITPILQEWGLTQVWVPDNQPKIAVISSPGQPTLEFKIASIYIDMPEHVLGREMSEQGKQDIPTEWCIVTKMGDRIR